MKPNLVQSSSPLNNAGLTSYVLPIPPIKGLDKETFDISIVHDCEGGLALTFRWTLIIDTTSTVKSTTFNSIWESESTLANNDCC
jgi:hypothetical protein